MDSSIFKLYVHFAYLQNFISIFFEGCEEMEGSTLTNASVLTQKTAEREDYALNQNLLRRFISFMTQFRKDHLREGVKNIYGRHYAVRAAPEFNFKEQWQRNRRKDFEDNNYYEIIQSESAVGYFYTAILLAFQVFLIWYYSTFRLLRLSEWASAQLLLVGSMCATCIDMSVKFYLKYMKTAQMVERWQVLATFRESIALLAYYSINMTLIWLDQHEEDNFIMYMVDFGAVWLLLRRAKGLYRHFKIRSYTTPYKNHFKIFDLFSNITAIEHLFALLMYLVSFYDSDNNWLMHYGHPDASNLQRYFYSFYFTSTTIFTIGYGDITPINNMEILCVLAIQTLGIVNFSYLINEIGFTLSSIRKEEEQLEHNISTLSKMRKYYHIEQDLHNLAKEHLLNNQKSFQEEMQPQEENGVLMKLNDQLRETLLHENKLNIIKSSLFFICHWTKNLQAEVAKRLEKRILAPNEPALQSAGKERIYIIKSGRLEIYTNSCLGFRRHFKKLLKAIQPTGEISDNVYGYSTVISGRQVKLQAISKDFTCVYWIDRAGFMECVHENRLDTEYYFQIKAKLDNSRYIQSFEAPATLNIRQHYRPIEMFIIKRNVHRLNKKKQHRREYVRHLRDPIVCTTRLLKGNGEVNITSNQIQLTFYEKEDAPKNLNRASLSDDHSLNEERSLGEASQPIREIESKELIMVSKFEAMKEYHKYYKKFNLTNVLAKLERENYKNTDYVEPVKFYEIADKYVLGKIMRVAPTKYYKAT